LLSAVVTPLLAIAAATFLFYLLVRGKDPEKARRGVRWGQIGSGSLVALAHGTNDAQKIQHEAANAGGQKLITNLSCPL
jgi:inorganic phosphate transporter, PiT family